MNSKDKGKRGENELARYFRSYGYDARRTQQYCGTNGDADLYGVPGIHVECKRVERLNLYDAIAQAVRDAKDSIPAVFHRKNNAEWLVTMRLDDWMKIYTEWEAGQHDTEGTGA